MPKWFKGVSNWQASRLFCFLFWFLKGFPNVNFRNSMSLRIGYVTKGLHTRSIMCPEWKWILALTFPNFTFTISLFFESSGYIVFILSGNTSLLSGANTCSCVTQGAAAAPRKEPQEAKEPKFLPRFSLPATRCPREEWEFPRSSQLLGK